MPELPEAETIRRQLEREVLGATIARVELYHPRTWRHHRSARELKRMVQGLRIVQVGRRGKAPYLSLDGATPTTLILRLGMTGMLRVARTEEANESHTAAVLALGDGREVRFLDARTFGALIARRGHDITAMPDFAHYGPEPLSGLFTPDYLKEAFAGRRARLQDVLMNQRVIAGIGKIYADEACFRARLRPGRRAGGLTGAMRERLWQAIREVLREGIECGGSSARDRAYLDIYGEQGEFQERMCVYQRTGEPCRSCGEPIRRTRMPGGRGMHWCPACQR
ncbi:MAG: bifunctional DNA-formamidopyrimidine glycosylase/DNA-(apurinic or apyrimidinic site) lyase [Armatimonadetes bacterium]|nr:bifunctional DNA-formamidopyrimidine glycosylase/DNA-(apurinic or apyrimidinic site) lyase [Armatimonadota bacterium]